MDKYKLLDGLYFGSCNDMLVAIKEGHFDVVINCANEVKSQDKFRNKKFRIVRGSAVSLMENMDAFIDYLYDMLSKGKTVFVHCNSGRTRTPYLMIYYLMMYGSMNYYEAYKKVEEVRSDIQLTEELNSHFVVFDELP